MAEKVRESQRARAEGDNRSFPAHSRPGKPTIALTVTGIVTALAAHAGLGGSDHAIDRLNQVLLVFTVTLVALAAMNAIFVTWATVLDARHSSALARALGATPCKSG